MQFTALQIATLLKGKLVGEPEAKINQVAKIEEAVSYTHLTLPTNREV